jgi:HK97 gp10 family phage protein
MDIKITGIRELSRTLDQLAPALMRSAETAVLRSGGGVIRKAAKANAGRSKDSGLLQKSIGLRVATVKGNKSARIGPRKGMKQLVTRKDKRTGRTRQEMADPNKYSHLVEYGTSHSAAKPFIRPAIDSTAGEVVGVMADGLDKHLTKVAARLAR